VTETPTYESPVRQVHAVAMDGAPPTVRSGSEWAWKYRDPLLAIPLVLLTGLSLDGELVGWFSVLVLLVAPLLPLVLLWRRRAPVVVACVLAAAFELTLVTDMGNLGLLVAAAVALYTLGSQRGARLSILVGAALFAIPVGATVISHLAGTTLYDPYAMSPITYSYGFNTGTLGGVARGVVTYLLTPTPVPSADLPLALALVAGLLVRQNRLTQQRATREHTLVETTRTETERRVLLEERAGIARDLHDSVAHHVNLMVIQAESGPDLVRHGEEDVLQGFRVIGDAGRRALAELDRTLAALREDTGAALAPQPRLDDLPALVEGTSGQGLQVELYWAGERRALDPAVELAAYRIVQESLTNIVRHAGTELAAVRVEYQQDGLSLQVTDRGAGFDPLSAPAGRGGHGLAGMRERARVHGGTLAIASAPGLGTAISAFLPG
jgi:signal transduction histidine kinase